MSTMNDDLDSLEPIDVAAEPPAGWPEGWYADPWTAGQYRYWSGQAWTGATHRWGPAHAPAAGAVTHAWPPPPTGYAVPAVPLPEPGPEAGLLFRHCVLSQRVRDGKDGLAPAPAHAGRGFRQVLPARAAAGINDVLRRGLRRFEPVVKVAIKSDSSES